MWHLTHLTPPVPQIVISVSRLDVRYAVLKPSFSPDQAVGMYLCTPEKGADGLAARKSAVRSDTEIVAEAGFASMEEAVLLTTLEPDTPYVLVRAVCLEVVGLAERWGFPWVTAYGNCLEQFALPAWPAASVYRVYLSTSTLWQYVVKPLTCSGPCV